MYVLQLTGWNGKYKAGAFVAEPRVTGGASYTYALQKAKTFTTRESAKAEQCGNEMIVSTDDLLRSPR